MIELKKCKNLVVECLNDQNTLITRSPENMRIDRQNIAKQEWIIQLKDSPYLIPGFRYRLINPNLTGTVSLPITINKFMKNNQCSVEYFNRVFEQLKDSDVFVSHEMELNELIPRNPKHFKSVFNYFYVLDPHKLDDYFQGIVNIHIGVVLEMYQTINQQFFVKVGLKPRGKVQIQVGNVDCKFRYLTKYVLQSLMFILSK